MGIEGLLQALKDIRVERNLREFEGQTAAIDASTWLYKGTYSCAFELAQGTQTYLYLNYSLKMLRLLQKYSIKPIFVFDGAMLPLKGDTIKSRKEEKAKNRKEGDVLRDEGKIEEANAIYARSLSIKKSMVYTLIDILETMKVEYIVSPYEADAQLAYLCKEKIADFVISEDSDILVYGCANVVYKLDYKGDCEYVNLEEIRSGEKGGDAEDAFISQLAALPKDKFIELCIVSGCDYLQNIPGFGIRKAIKMLSSLTLEQTLARICYQKSYIGKIPPGFKEKVRKIKHQFLYGRVIDPVTLTMTTLNPIPEGIKKEELVGIGELLKPDIVGQYAKGLYNLKKNASRLRIKKEDIDEILSELSKKYKGKVDIDKKDSGVIGEDEKVGKHEDSPTVHSTIKEKEDVKQPQVSDEIISAGKRKGPEEGSEPVDKCPSKTAKLDNK